MAEVRTFVTIAIAFALSFVSFWIARKGDLATAAVIAFVVFLIFMFGRC